jgi:hypothetical protein
MNWTAWSRFLAFLATAAPAMLMCVPLLAWLLLLTPPAGQLSQEVRMAIALMAACPSAPLLLRKAGKTGGDASLAGFLQVLAAVLAIITVPLPSTDPALAGVYDVDFNAYLELDEAGLEGSKEVSHEDVDRLMAHTLVRWQLDLAVWIRLPSMLNLLPERLVQSSGDHLLKQIVRQISRKLTWKVQEDFHTNHGIPCPPRRRARF